ncbi:hypothetical protein AJ79_05595 [Helicocarpus griseus UAMH5409]|uniref:RING-type E3 ubiquitin transferase n=1 Tax=Helicocarpus griseus UAMH5409 TaxID=1447875 RepID=A0A2B7XMP5_9EURO|nr:hypothetical protein AJ79_05595 [Helicocarpus griseus UAMH5409]
MRPPRLILLLACFIFLPILLTTLSLLSAHPQHGQTSQASSVSGGVGRFKTLFSFHAPSSLFPPSAMISLTDDNSTFFLARPAAFGPALPSTGLSGQLWIGSGFGDDALRKGGLTTGAEGELGCSDVPGWEDSGKSQNKEAGSSHTSERLSAGMKAKNGPDNNVEALHKRGDERSLDLPRPGGKENHPTKDDGTDDHLHHPLPESGSPATPNADKNKQLAHADIQSLQESAEIRGKIVLLSRGGCGFLEKVKWTQRRGGIALIVGDHTRGGGLVTMYARGDTSNVTIPALFTSHTTAHLLSSLIPPEVPSEPSSPEDLSKSASGDKADKNPKNGKPAAATKAASKPTSTAASPAAPPRKGFLHSLFSAIGLWRENAYPWHLQEDSHRPPSSGNIDWVMLNEFDEEETPSPKKPAQSNKAKEGGKSPSSQDSESRQGSNDDFVIGVQDWRDPDLVVAGNNDNSPKPTSKPETSTSKQKGDDAKGRAGDNNPNPSGNGLKGGSITPGSGEYAPQDKSTNGKGTGRDSNRPSAASDSRSGNSRENSHWWFGLGGTDDDESSRSVEDKSKGQSDKKAKEATAPVHKSSKEGSKHPDHEGLWVTLTPTSMSTSPFFDTLLVLVVSPLITLTVVYALLLLRSRIRRRRWRAPKAVVDRLPVRTYHTITSMSSSSGSPQAGPSPEASSPSSPLLSHPRARSPRPRQRSQTTSGIVAASSHDASNESPSNGAEKSNAGSSLWRRRYTGRQVECVVCLEEYIDGQSRVMSLPCGHEFHAECITPWLTTRRRTCPICKGDVVRSMGHRSSSSHRSERPERMSDDIQARIAETRNDSPSAAIPLSQVPDDIDSDLERGDSTTSLVNNSQNSNTQSNWRNLASLSISALSGDAMWHQPRSPRSDRNR